MANFKLICGTLLLFISSALCQDDLFLRHDSLFQIYKLQEVVVYGDRDQIKPSMVTEMKLADIKARNATTVAEVLKSDVGLNITSGYKGESETKLRGFPARDVLVLVDGRPINPGYYGTVDLSLVPLNQIAKISVIKGPASVAYGANSMGGVINIVTRNGFDKPKTNVDVRVGDYQFRDISINHSRKLGKMNYWISGYENHSNGYALSADFPTTSLEDGGFRKFSTYHKMGVSGKMGYEFSPENLCALSLSYHWAEKDIPVTIYSWDAPRYWYFPKWERYSGALSGQWQLTPAVELKTIVFADAYNDRLISYLSSETNDDNIDYDSILENWTVGSSIEARVNAHARHQLHTGIHFKRDLMNKKPDLQEPWRSYYLYTGSLFIQDDIQLFEKTELTAGVNYSFYNFEVREAMTGRICPMISLKQRFPASINFYTSYASAMRVPTLHHLFSESSGNLNLKEEYANKYEIGLSKIFALNRARREVSLEIAYFYNDLKNLIYRSSRSYQYKNISEAQLAGIEIRGGFRWNQFFACNMSYTYLHAGLSSQELMEYTPEHKIQLQLKGRTGFGTEINYEVISGGERTTYLTTRMLPLYRVHNLNISQTIAKNYQVRLEMNNLTDEYYEEELGFPTPGRQIFAGFSLSF